MERRSFGWLALNAVLWGGVGCAATLLVERVREQRPSLADLGDEALARMQRLDLDAAQQDSLARIRDEWSAQIVAEERAWLDRLDQAAASADAKVAALLSPEQARRYRELALGTAATSR
jgi:hypothetical protein